MIGLVGGIGAGKSLVAEALERRGAFVLDADAVGHALLEQRPAGEAVLRRFGRDILIGPTEPGQPPRIDRKALGAVVFSDPSARRDLEAILHPRMRRTFERAIARTVRGGNHRAVVLDAAILFEAGWDRLCDRVVFVDAPRDQRLERVAARRGWTIDDLRLREAAQMPLAEKQARADATLVNAGTPEALDEQVGRMWHEQIRPARRPPRGEP